MSMYYLLSDLSLLKIQGQDAKQFLQGQLTCDLDAVTTDRPAMGAHCNPQGRVISLFYLFFYQGAYYLLMPRPMVPITLAALQKYSIFFKAELSICSAFTLIGQDLIGNGPGNEPLLPGPPGHIAQILVSPSRCITVYDDQTGENPPWDKSNDRGMEQWKLLNIIDGIPAIYPETTGKCLPHDIHLHQLGAIHFAKGCYTGQEIIARVHYRGKSKNHLYTASIASSIPPSCGSDIFTLEDGKPAPCGLVIETTSSGPNQYTVLVMANEISASTQTLYWGEMNIALALFSKGEKKHAQ